MARLTGGTAVRWEDLRSELDRIPGVLESFESHYPYHDVSLAVAGVRAELDMTQTEFGALVGIPQSSVARLESGQQNPSVGMLKRIAKATGAELVIEFRPRPRTRKTSRRPPRDRSTPARSGHGERVAASGQGR